MHSDGRPERSVSDVEATQTTPEAMTDPPEISDNAVAELLTALDHRVGEIEPMGGMSTSRVWRAETDQGRRVVRIAYPRPGKVPRFAADALVRRRLA